MAKKKKETALAVVDDTGYYPTSENKDIIKAFGDCLLDARMILENPPPLISVTPKLDIALGGGVPEGSLFIMTGPEKVGKTVHALQFAKNSQDVQVPKDEARKVWYANIEGRLKKRDIEGILGLDYSTDKFEIVGSTKGNILSGEKYLGILDNIIHSKPHSVAIVDSFSALCSEAELTSNIEDQQVAAMNRFIAKFTRRFANVLPINRVTLVGITHLMANINKFGRGKAKVEKSGNALKYAQDVKLWATHRTPLLQGETQIGQEVHWVVENSAIGPPGQKCSTYIKYGRGIWNEREVAELAKDFGLVEGSTWLKLPSGKKVQGMNNFAIYLEENPEAYKDLRSQVFELVGM